MKILIILAHSTTDTRFLTQFIYEYIHPSLTLEQLAAITPNQYDLEIIDGRYQQINYNWDGDIVGISSRTVAANNAYKIADEFRRRGKKVVLGGFHPSFLPMEAIQHADSVVVGEAEISWPQLLKDFEQGNMKRFYYSDPVDPKIIPPAKRIKRKHNLVSAPIQATRGCPYNCSFCPIYKVQGLKLRTRPIDNIIEEIKTIPSKYLFFVDNSLTIKPDFTKQLFRKMIGLNKKFSCYGNVNALAKDEELLKIASEAGCEIWILGFESVSQETINDIGKPTNIVKNYNTTIKKIHDYGMMIQGLFILGFDTDTPDVFDNTLNSIDNWELDKAGFAILTPFPGTSLFEKLEKENRIISKDWSKYNLKNVVFQPKNMTPEELFNGTNRILNKFYTVPHLIKRSLQDENISFNRILSRAISEISSKQFYKIFGF